MRRCSSLFAAAVFALGVAAPVFAQEEGPTFIEVSQVELAPADADAFLEAVKTVRDAAVEIGLDPDFAWDVYRWDNTIYFVSWHESMSVFEDPEAFARAFAGTPVESRVMAAFESANSLDFRSGSNAVSRGRPDLGFVPAESAVTPGEHGGVYVLQQWPAGNPQAYEESIRGFMGMLAEMGGIYPVYVSQNVIGDGGYAIVVPFDDLSSFYGENSLQARLENSPIGPRWQEHGQSHAELLNRSQSFHLLYMPEHSYTPEGM